MLNSVRKSHQVGKLRENLRECALQSMKDLFVKTLREDPADADVESHKLLLRGSYIRRVAPGVFTWLPLALRIREKVCAIVRQEMAAVGAQEVRLPALLPAEAYKATNRWGEYGENLFRLQDRRKNDYLLAPTHEEQFTLLVKDLVSSYKDLPLTLYQIQTKYRDEARPRAGLLRGREFLMKDAYSFDIDKNGLDHSYALQRRAYQRIFGRLGLEYVICSAVSGAMGGSKSEEFHMPTEVGEDTFVQSPGGYVANVEAVVTPVPEAVPLEGQPSAHVEETPGCVTIDQLVQFANTSLPRSDRPWRAADTLKNVVVALTHPEGEREVVVIGVPGDREVDLKRLEAALAPAVVEVATEADFAAHPELVPGYIGPAVIGPNSAHRQVDTDGNLSGSVRYLVDPRIVEGTRWITGANESDKHVFDLVMGRDFAADGTVEAAAVQEGDLAPDGSGPLSLRRGVELGHIFQLGQKYASALGLQVLDQNGRATTVTMGSYGIGISRVIAALAEANHDELGLKWPIQVAPFEVHIVVAGKGVELDEAARALAVELESAGAEVLVDDRAGVSAGVKFADAELLGMPIIVVVGRGLKTGLVELRNRQTGLATDVPVGEAVQNVLALREHMLAATAID